jgi:hypothetical protein
MYFFVLRRVAHTPFVAVAWTVTLLSEVFLGVFPAIGHTRRLHEMLALSMAVGMLATAFLFAWSLQGGFMPAELLLALTMCVLALGITVNRRNFIYYELPFIFLAHISILITVIALR